MTLKIVRIIFFIIIGFAIGVLAYHLWGNSFNTDDAVEGRTDVVDNQSDKEINLVSTDPLITREPDDNLAINTDINNQLSIQRYNAITEAVKKVSPAVVSVNVMKVELAEQLLSIE